MSTTTRHPSTAPVLGEAVTEARTTAPELAVTGEVITGAAA
jgi:hypothetical protein